MTLPGGRLIGFVRRHAMILYLVLACVISWLLVSPLIAAGLGIVDRHPSQSWHALGALGPLIAAILMTALMGGRPALRDLAHRVGRWRVGWVWWAFALSPIALGAMAAAGLAVAGAPLGNASLLQRAFADRAWVLSMFVASLAYGVGEEPGWRGFALPHLQRSRSAFHATVLLTLGWGLWHVPYFLYRYHLAGPGEYLGFYLGLFAGALWLTFLYNSTGGSVLIVVVWHTVWNAVALIATVISPALVAVTSALIMLSGFAALAVGGPQRMSWTPRRTPASTTPRVT